MMNFNAKGAALTLGLSSLMLGTSAFANNYVERSFEQAYKKFNGSAYIDCNGVGVKHISSEFVKNDKIQSVYSKNGEEFTVTVNINDGDLSASLESDNLNVSGYVKRKWVYFNYFNLQGSEKEAYKNIMQESKVGCYVKTAYSAPHTLEDSLVHINVHPHKIYDGKGHTTAGVNSYLNDRSLESIILLDFKTTNYTARRWTSWARTDYVNDIDAFMEDAGESIDFRQGFKGTNINLQPDNPIIVSQAGHNPYTVVNHTQSVIYTGGNHNYCTSNNSKNLLRAAMKSKESKVVNITYDLSATVVQQNSAKGIGLSFEDYSPRVSGIHLGNVLSKHREFASEYHRRYFNNLVSYGIEKAGKNLPLGKYYEKVIIRYQSEHGSFEKTIQGTGQGVKRVNINYINE